VGLRFVTFLAPSIKPLYQFIADRVGERLNVATELVVGRSYAQAVDGGMDFGFICGLAYVMLKRDNPDGMLPIAAPVLMGNRYRARPIYFSDVIVHRDSPIESFQDLRGRTWAFNEPLSQSGYGIVRQKLVEMGETGGFFGEVIEAGFHQRSIRLVRGREVDAAAIDAQVLEVELRDHPELGKDLRLIESLGPSTIQPIVATERASDILRAEVVDLLLEMADDPDANEVMTHGLVERFTEVGVSDYDDIRQMVREAEQAEFMIIK
jgi:phosphonate transport system substrate-binding protein